MIYIYNEVSCIQTNAPTSCFPSGFAAFHSHRVLRVMHMDCVCGGNSRGVAARLVPVPCSVTPRRQLVGVCTLQTVAWLTVLLTVQTYGSDGEECKRCVQLEGGRWEYAKPTYLSVVPLHFPGRLTRRYHLAFPAESPVFTRCRA